MAVQYTCDVCGKPIDEGEPLQKYVLFRGKHSLNRSIVYAIDLRDYCRPCAEKDAEPFRRKRGRPTVVSKIVPPDPHHKSEHWNKNR